MSDGLVRCCSTSFHSRPMFGSASVFRTLSTTTTVHSPLLVTTAITPRLPVWLGEAEDNGFEEESNRKAKLKNVKK